MAVDIPFIDAYVFCAMHKRIFFLNYHAVYYPLQ